MASFMGSESVGLIQSPINVGLQQTSTLVFLGYVKTERGKKNGKPSKNKILSGLP